MVTTTTVYSFQKPDVSGDEDAWGGYLNANIDKYESILTGNTTITSLVITTADINGGTLDNVVIGGSTAAAVTGTTITGTSFVSSGNMTFGDNNKALFGAGSDLEVYHNGTNSVIYDNGTGNLQLVSGGASVDIIKAGGENMATFATDGAATLYYDNSAKIATSSSGISVTGNATFADNGKAIFGAGSDLQIYHTGTDSFIQDANTGVLAIDTNGTDVRITKSNAEFMAKFETDGAVTLYYDNAAKIATTSTGIDVTGTVTADSLTVDGDGGLVTSDGAILKLENSSTALTNGSVVGDLQFYANDTSTNATGAKAFIKATSETSGGTNIGLTLATSDSTSATGLSRIRIDADGDISFYEDTGTTAKFFWDASAEALAIGTATSVSNNRLVIDQASGDGQNSGFYMQRNGGAGTSFKIDIDSSDVVNLRRSATTALAIDSSNNVGIGTDTVSLNSAYDRTIHIHSTLGSLIKLTDATSGTTDTDGTELLNYGNDTYLINRDVGNIIFNVTSAERMRIDSSGQVGIGVTSPSSYNAAANNLVISDGGNAGITIVSPSTDSGSLFFADGTSGTAAYAGFVQYGHAAEKLLLGTGGTTKVIIDGSGRLLLNTTVEGYTDYADDFTISNTSGRSGMTIRSGTTSQGSIFFSDVNSNSDAGGYAGYVTYHHNDNRLAFGTSGAERMRITSDGKIGVGTTTPSDELTVNGNQQGGDVTIRINNDDTVNAASNSRLRLTTPYNEAYIAAYTGGGGAGYLVFANENAERMRISPSGSVAVGGTSFNAYQDSADQYEFNIYNNGQFASSVNNMTSGYLNRQNGDGDILDLRRDGSQIGVIGVTGYDMYLGTTDTGLRFVNATDSIEPLNTSTLSRRDNAIDLGSSGYRFDDIYATNGTIQTSDANEKQDIAELTDAEQRVAVAAKGLLRKFRWKTAVAEKGDEARTHFGIIAQDLQAAFAAEGLDASDYAMFISTTWTDEETGEERTRMGVRYSELLAFIIAAI